jgi:2-iminobutanoate/2-iminopropanoate deaminase
VFSFPFVGNLAIFPEIILYTKTVSLANLFPGRYNSYYILYRERKTIKMKKSIVSTSSAPAAIGPYSQGAKAAGLVFTSGQLPIDMATGELELADIKKAAKNSLDNVKAILAEAGATMADIVKTTVFLTDMNDFAAMNEVYATYFESEPPARSCVAVAALPKGAKVEIEAVAAV